MIKEVYILHRESGLPLIHTHISHIDDDPDSFLFSGALQGIRSFLKECKIGDLTSFTTQENIIEVRCDIGVVIAVVADVHDPPKEQLSIITEEIGSLFTSLYEDEIKNFSGALAPFNSFEPELKEFIRVQLEETSIMDSKTISPSKMETSFIENPNENKKYLNFLSDWIKNRFDPTGKVMFNVTISCPPDKSKLNLDILLEGGERRMNRLDRWLVKRIPYGGTQNAIFVIELDATHGPAQIRQILQKIIKIGNPRFSKESDVYKLYPSEVVFIGSNIEKNSFHSLDDIIKLYKSEHIIISEYANHIHREHSPHHEFFRCKVSGWKWNLSEIKPDNVPLQVYP